MAKRPPGARGAPSAPVRAFILAVPFTAMIVAPSAGKAMTQQESDELVARNIQTLDAARPGQRRLAAQDLGNFTMNQVECQASLNAVPALVKLLGDSDEDVRRAAAFAIGNIHGDPHGTVPALIVALADPDSHVRAQAARALESNANCAEYNFKGTGTQVDLAVPALLKAMRDPDSDVRDAAAKALTSYGRDAVIGLPELIKLLKDPDSGQQVNAVKAIGAIGADAQPAVASLTTLLRDKAIYVRLEAGAALAEVGANLPQALSVVGRALTDDSPFIRTRAAIVLGRFGAAALPAIPRLTAALRDRDEDVRDVAVHAFRDIAQALVEAHRTEAIKPLRTAATALERSDDPQVLALLPDISEAADALETMQTANGR